MWWIELASWMQSTCENDEIAESADVVGNGTCKSNILGLPMDDRAGCVSLAGNWTRKSNIIDLHIIHSWGSSHWPKQPMCRSRWSEIAATILRCESFAGRWHSTCEINNLQGSHTIFCDPCAGRVRLTCGFHSVNHPSHPAISSICRLTAIDLQVPFPERYIERPLSSNIHIPPICANTLSILVAA
jgi:hypothetical protein